MSESNVEVLSSTPDEDGAAPRVSVAIECANARDLGTWQELLETLHSLQEQSYSLDRCEVLIATLPLADEKKSEIRDALPVVRLVEMDRHIYNRFKNRCLDEAKGEIVVLADSDIQYEPSWLENMIRCFDDEPDRILVAGNTQYEPGLIGPPQSLCDWDFWRPESGPTNSFAMNNMAVRRKFFPYRFDESFSGNGDGGAHMIRQRVLADGIEPWFCFEAVGYHTVGGTVARRMRRGAHAWRMRRLHPEIRGAWAARVPLLGPVLVVAGITVTALGRAVRYRHHLPGGTLALPWAMLGVILARLFDLAGAVFYAWTPDSARKLHYFAIPKQEGQQAG